MRDCLLCGGGPFCMDGELRDSGRKKKESGEIRPKKTRKAAGKSGGRYRQAAAGTEPGAGKDRSMEKRKDLGILFIGNSHTYYNDMPLMVKRRADEEGYDCRVTMIAHGGWYLSQHVKEPDVRFNILYGKYDYIVMQEHAHPFGPEEDFLEAAAALNRMIREAGSTPVVYECWAKKDEPEIQDYMNGIHRRAADETGALLAPVGEYWWGYRESRPDLEMYAPDGRHASPAGSDFAAGQIWSVIREDLSRKGK